MTAASVQRIDRPRVEIMRPAQRSRKGISITRDTDQVDMVSTFICYAPPKKRYESWPEKLTKNSVALRHP